MARYIVGSRQYGGFVPFEAKDDKDALMEVRNIVKKNYKKFLIQNEDTGRIFDLFGDDA